MARRLIATAHVLLEDRPQRRPFGSLEMYTEHHSTPTTSPDTTRRRAFLLDRAAKYYETIRPWCVSNERGSFGVKSSRKIMDGGRLKMSLLHVVSSRPEKLDRSFGGTRNVRCFDSIIDSEAPAKSTTNQSDVYIHIGRCDTEQLGNLFL